MLITAIKQKLQDEFVANAAASHPVSNVNIYFLWNIDLFLWNIDLFLWKRDELLRKRDLFRAAYPDAVAAAAATSSWEAISY